MKVLKFKRDEDGALLVFFAICAAAIFLVASLSFDLGKRASTQTELQSFADNVALAAAGELNGFPNAIKRAERAASELIKDNFVFGTEADDGGDAEKTLQGEDDYEIFFYATLPPVDETELLAPGLPKDATSDRVARFARVVVKDVNVDWNFANLLSIFSDDYQALLEDTAVNAEAVAGYTALSCDVAPVFFCLPPNEPGEPEWSPEQEIGNSILLKAGGQSGGNTGPSWTPGNFSWLNVIAQADAAWTTNGVYKPDGPCAEFAKNSGGKFNPDLYECLFSAGTGTLCFENGQLDTKPGGTEGVITAVFNTRFDIFGKGSGSNQTDSIFAPAPIVTTGLEADSTCGSSTTPTATTMGLPADDCFTGHGDGDCDSYDGTLRYGDGDWNAGRLFYADVNYSFDASSVGDPFTFNSGDPENNAADDIKELDNLDNLAIIQDELVEIEGQVYHRYDPMRPTGDVPKPFVYKLFPELDHTASQWEYYQAEVAASLYDNSGELLTREPNTDEYVFNYASGNFRGGTEGSPYELIQDVDNPSGEYDRLGTSLPNCAEFYDINPMRRTLVAAVLDCSDEGINEGINGFTKDMTAQYFVDIFLLTSSGTMRDTTVSSSSSDFNLPNPNADKEIFVQIIGPALNTGKYVKNPGRFRNLVQLYR